MVSQSHRVQSFATTLWLQHKSCHLLPIHTPAIQANRVAFDLDLPLRVMSIHHGHSLILCLLLLLFIPNVHPLLAVLELACRDVTDFPVKVDRALLCILELLL